MVDGMKNKAGGIPDDTEDDATPECAPCGYQVGLGNDALLILRGQWLPSVEYDVPVFILDPATELRIVEFPNGQLGLVSDVRGQPTQHAHTECFEYMLNESLDDVIEDDDEDEEI